MSEALQKKNFFVSYLSSGAIEEYLFYSFILAGILVTPLVAYFTSDWIWIITPMMLSLVLLIPTAKGIIAEVIVHAVMYFLSIWDDLIGAETDVKAGLALFSGMAIGLVLNVITTLFSLISLWAFT